MSMPDTPGTLSRLTPQGLIDALSGEALSPGYVWVALLLTALLLVPVQPFRNVRTLDLLSLILVGLALILLGSPDGYEECSPSGCGEDDPAARLWGLGALVVVLLYWAVRGLGIGSSRSVVGIEATVTPRALTLLMVAGLALATGRIALGPVEAGARDGLRGGVHLAQTGTLPYGALRGDDGRSPLLYALYAGGVRTAGLFQDDRSLRLTNDPDGAALAIIQFVGAFLFIVLFAGVVLLGSRLHSALIGQTLGVALCLSPTLIDSLGRPEMLLPAGLIVWTLYFATLRGVGGLLAMLTVTAAGLAWPWAWLLIPALLGYFATRGWQIFGATVGLTAAVAASVVGVGLLTKPALPRLDGAVLRAGWQPEFAARREKSDLIIIESAAQDEDFEGDFKSWLWRWALRREGVMLSAVSEPLAMPTGRDAQQIMLCRVQTDNDTFDLVRDAYREAMRDRPRVDEALGGLRTAFEATYAGRRSADLGEHWSWVAGRFGLEEPGMSWTRRTVKLFTGMLAVALGLLLSRMHRAERRQLIGASLMILSLALLAGLSSPALGVPIVLPLGLLLFAIQTDRQAKPA